MRKLLASTLSLTLLSLLACCQRQTVPGIYAGVKLSIGLWGSMDRTDVVLYLRPDGTFTDELEETDWQTRVNGTYTVEGKQVTLTYQDGDTDSYELTDKGGLDGGNYVLIRMAKSKKLPTGGFKYTGASGGGGGLSGVPYVGTFRTRYIHFDGDGNFSHNTHNAVMIAGDNIGGGSSSDKDDRGTYAYHDGVLTLTYRNGEKSTHSVFFTDDGDGKDFIVLDGRLYFEEDGKENEGKDSKAKKAGRDRSLPAARDLLREVKKAHGGEAIDRVRNTHVTAEIEGGARVSIRTDYENGQSISEMHVAGKLVYAEVYTHTEKWQWANSKRTDISPNRIKEIANHAYLGANGLHKDRIGTLEKGKVTTGDDGGFTLSYEAGGQTFTLGIDPHHRIVREEKTDLQGRKTIISLDDFRKADGLLKPFYEKHVSEGDKIVVRISAYEVNTLTEGDWDPARVLRLSVTGD